MGYNRQRAWDDLFPLSLTMHLFIIASIVIAMTAYWAKINFSVANPSWVDTSLPPASVSAFHCPTHEWFVFAYNGFCNQQRLEQGSRGRAHKTNCLTWGETEKWRRMDEQNIFGSDFTDGIDNWQAVGALLALALFVAVITTFLTGWKDIYNPWSLGISAFLVSIIFDATFVAWILGETSDQMQPNFWDGMSGCGNSQFKHGVGFGFCVVASFLSLFMTFVLTVACVADALDRFAATREVKGRPGEEMKYDTSRAEDRQVQGYRPDIVA